MIYCLPFFVANNAKKKGKVTAGLMCFDFEAILHARSIMSSRLAADVSPASFPLLIEIAVLESCVNTSLLLLLRLSLKEMRRAGEKSIELILRSDSMCA